MNIDYGFGSRLMLECYGCPKDKLADRDFVFDVLDTFLPKINMAKIASPQVFKYQGEEPAQWGISGVALSTDFHISIHTFPDKEQVFISIFSSTNFDTSFARSKLLNLFCATHHEVKEAIDFSIL